MKTYKKIQYGIFLSLFFLVIIIFILYAGYYQTGSNPIPMNLAYVLSALFILTILLFYKLTITITNEKITASFGVGLIKKSMPINQIATIEKVKMPWYYGVGIRLTPKGWLWNVKVGEAILIHNKNKTKTFLVGTDDYQTIETILKQH